MLFASYWNSLWEEFLFFGSNRIVSEPPPPRLPPQKKCIQSEFPNLPKRTFEKDKAQDPERSSQRVFAYCFIFSMRFYPRQGKPARRKLHEQKKGAQTPQPPRDWREGRIRDRSFMYSPSFWCLPPLREDSFVLDSFVWSKPFMCVQVRVLTHGPEDCTTFAPAVRNLVTSAQRLEPSKSKTLRGGA
eukprot:3558196-Amphidinium_carterae.2